MKQKTASHIPDIKEFIDDSGKKWVQTSTDDLFSMNELNDIFEKIERERNTGEVLLARIDFQKVNREYYDAAIDLQKKLMKQQELLKKMTASSKQLIERKNKKLKELIEYIKKLHAFINYISSQESLEGIEIPLFSTVAESDTEDIIPFAEVEGRIMDPDEDE